MTYTSSLGSSYQPRLVFYELRPDQDASFVAEKFGAETVDPTAHSAQPGAMLIFNPETMTLST